MNKKAIAILGAIFILIVGTLGFLIFSKYGGKKTVTPPVTQGENNPAPATTTPVVEPEPQPAKKFNKLIDDLVVSPALFYNGRGVTYFSASGQLYQATFEESNGQLQISDKQSLDIEARRNIEKILWPAQGDNYLAQFSGSQPTWSFYNSDTRSYKDLPSEVEAIDWMPSGDKSMYVWLQNGKATLNSGDPDTGNWKYIADMWETDDAIDISPDGKNILYFEQNTGTSTNPINLTTPDGKIWKTLVRTGYNFGTLWSPDSEKFLFGKRDKNGKMQLWYYNLLTDEVKNLGLYTIPEKAAWGKDSQTVFAAVPTSGTPGTNSLTVDTFYKIDVESLDKQEYNPEGANMDGRDLFLDSAATRLFFKNAQDGALYYLDLTQ